jgi:Chalcone isomerase-like
MDMYVAGLYLIEKSRDAAGIVAANSPMVIKITIVSGLISSSAMTEAVEEGFRKSTGGNLIPYRDKIEKFKKAFNDEIKKGDVFDIVYSGKSISVYKNNMVKIEIEGFDFKKVVFGIWFGNDPADKNLKMGMLGILN